MMTTVGRICSALLFGLGVAQLSCGHGPVPSGALPRGNPPNPIVRADEGNIASFERWLNESAPSPSKTPELSPSQAYTRHAVDNASVVDIGDKRVVGGKLSAEIDAIGAVLLLNESGVASMHCTGTLISPLVVLSAAHCVYDFDVRQMLFAIGPDAHHAKRTIRFDKAIWPTNYSPKSWEDDANDIAILYLATPVSDIEPVRLPSPAQDVESWLKVGPTMTFVGYGYDLNTKGLKYRLGNKARVEIPVSSFSSRRFKYTTPGRNTCDGDSGGPAILIEKEKVTVIGITSWGDTMCNKDGVDTRVDAYLPWLSQYVPLPSTTETDSSKRGTASESTAADSIGVFNEAMARSTLRTMLKAARSCSVRRAPIAGRLAVTFAPNGSVVDASIEQPTPLDGATGDCLLNHIREIALKPFAGAETSIHQTFFLD
jgi:secreted trypsin-like serine protease